MARLNSRSFGMAAWAAAVFAIIAAPSGVVHAIEDPDCTLKPTVRWASTSDRVYLEDGGCITPTAIVEARMDQYGPKGPLYHFHRGNNTIATEWTGDFFLNSSLYIEDNVRLDVIGKKYGGDVNRFLLRSDQDKFINVRAHGGQIMLKGVKVRSFDGNAYDGYGGADKNIDDGRSYISAISEIVLDESETCDGRAKNTKGESRLDIIDSKITQLGYDATESYGISYKVRGLCTDSSNLELMDSVNVYGDILYSELAYNYFGHYSYGHQGGNWLYNEVHHNYGYGFDPHDDSDYVTIHANNVYKNGLHGIIASQRCDHVSIQNNVVRDNGKNAIMLHRSCNYSTVAHNTAYDNGDAGLALFETSHTEVYNNTFVRNTYGVRWSVGSNNNNVYNNILDVTDAKTPKHAAYMYRGSDEVDVEGSDGRPKDNKVYSNTMKAPTETLKIKDADYNNFEDNEISGEMSRFRDARGNFVADNTFSDGQKINIEGDTCFKEGSDEEFTPICD